MAKMKPHKPAKMKSPILEKMKGKPPGGAGTPGAKGTYPMPKKKKAARGR